MGERACCSKQSASLARLRVAGLVRSELDQLARDAGAAQTLERPRRKVRGQLHDGVVRADVDVPEVLATEAALVRDGADDLARLDLLPLAHGDAIGRERHARPAT